MAPETPAEDPPDTASDPVLVALRDLCAVLKENSRRNQEMLKRARSIEKLRGRGLSYTEIVGAGEGATIVTLTRENLEALYDAGARLRRAEAKALHDEGLTMDQIAERFGVTRQRISALLRPRKT